MTIYLQHNSIELLLVKIIYIYYVFMWEDKTGRSAKRKMETAPFQFLDTCDSKTPVYTYKNKSSQVICIAIPTSRMDN